MCAAHHNRGSTEDVRCHHEYILICGSNDIACNRRHYRFRGNISFVLYPVLPVLRWESSEDGEVHGVLINSTMYLRESEIKQVAQLIKDEKLRNRVLTLMRSHRRIVSAPEKENRSIREIASEQMLSQG